MKIDHNCPRTGEGSIMRLDEGQKCPLCGATALDALMEEQPDELRERLRALDQRRDVTVTPWEAGFIESVLKWDGPLTPKQTTVVERILEEYE